MLLLALAFGFLGLGGLLPRLRLGLGLAAPLRSRLGLLAAASRLGLAAPCLGLCLGLCGFTSRSLARGLGCRLFHRLQRGQRERLRLGHRLRVTDAAFTASAFGSARAPAAASSPS